MKTGRKASRPPAKKDAPPGAGDRFLAAAGKVADALRSADYDALRSLLSQRYRDEHQGGTPEEEKKRFEAQAAQLETMMGRVQKAEILDLEHPDGAFVTLHFERGTGEIFLALDETGRLTALDFLKFQRPGTSEPPEHPSGGAEHPGGGSEHPGGGSEHPGGGPEHPRQRSEDPAEMSERPRREPGLSESEAGSPDLDAAPKREPARIPAREPATVESVALFLDEYVAERIGREGGRLTIRDERSGANLALSLVRVHRDRLARIGEGRYFVCADFSSADGKTYDLDFWVAETPGGLSVAETAIHKEAGVPRYRWVEEGGIWRRKPI